MLESFLSRKRAEIVNKLMPSSHRKGRILDIGCGAYPHFLINTQFSEKYGIDRLVGRKESYKISDKNIILKECDISKDILKTFQNGYFDAITMLAVFEHLEPRDISYIIGEMKRVLKPDGVLILTTPAVWTSIILKILATLRLVDRKMIMEHKALYGTQRIVSIFTNAGFLRENIKFGKFELFMNTWIMAVNSSAKRSK